MNKSIYICDVEKSNPDYIFTEEVVVNHGDSLSVLDSAEICLFNAGVYISGHNAKKFEELLQKATHLNKQVFVLKPYGTSYMPLYFRRLSLPGIELLRSQIEAVLEDREPDEAYLTCNRYR